MQAKRVWKYLLPHQTTVVWILVLAAAGLLGMTYFVNGNGTTLEMVVEKKPFIREVSVSGKVMAGNEVDLGFSQAGRIAGVYVKEGQVVQRGALITEIENGDLYAALVQRRAALDREEAELDALKRGTRAEELAVYESAVSASVASKKAAEQSVLDAVLSAYSTSDAAVRATTDPFFSNPNSATPQLTFLSSNLALESRVESERVAVGLTLASWQGETLSHNTQNIIVAATLAQANLTDVATYLSDVSGVLAASIPSSSITQATLDTYKASAATARTSVNTAISTLTATQKVLSAAETALVTAERDLALKRAGATKEDIRAQEATVAAAEADVLSAASQLQKTQIRAPFPGTVTKIDAEAGKSVSPGEPQASLIGTGVYEIESFVPEINVALVKVGDRARITFDSYGDDALFSAEVVSVDLGETIKDGVSTYRTVLVFSGEDPRIRSGMTANVAIVTEERTDVISIPEGAITFTKAGAEVRLRVGKEVVTRIVDTGSTSSLGEIEIISGISVGDIVVLE